MKRPENHAREDERLAELESYSILDSLPESDFDNLTAIAAAICDTPISLVSILDEKRQWFKSHHGLEVTETAKELAFCAHAINAEDEAFIVADARKDKRFFDNPLVTGDPHVIFYAGVPLMTDSGLPMGTLCVIDDKPRSLTSVQIASLRALSQQVMNLFELRRSKAALEKTLSELKETNEGLEKFAYIAAHDLKSPINSISGIAQYIGQKHGNQLEPKIRTLLERILTSSNRLKDLIDGLLNHSKSDTISRDRKEWVDLNSLMDEIRDVTQSEPAASIVVKSDLSQVFANRTVLYHVLINLVSNAVKYNDTKVPKIEVRIEEEETLYRCSVTDNGPGIDPIFSDKIFELFGRATAKDRFGRPGSGIGLATVKKLVERSGGSIELKSASGGGSTFLFTLSK